MEWLIIFCLTLSSLNLYFFFKKSNQKSFEQELEEFRTYTETLITEFNRVTTRNVSMLDERIEELNHKIRLSQKVDLLLKERFEEANKIELLKPLQLDQVYQESLQKTTSQEKKHNSSTHILEKLIDKQEESTATFHSTIPLETPNIIDPIIGESDPPIKQPILAENTLFEGVEIQKIKKHQTKKKRSTQEELLFHIQENKSKEELLDLGFTSNEINIAQLYQNTQEK